MIPINVFIVEDDLFYSHMLEFSIKKMDVSSLQVFENGSECLKELDQQPDFILLDYQLGDYDGIQILEVIKEKCPQAKVLLLSAQKEVQVAIQALKLGAADYIVKNEESFAKVGSIIKELGIEKEQQIKGQRKRFGFPKIGRAFR